LKLTCSQINQRLRIFSRALIHNSARAAVPRRLLKIGGKRSQARAVVVRCAFSRAKASEVRTWGAGLITGVAVPSPFRTTFAGGAGKLSAGCEMTR
jgi:hypothetical protein